jgi:hypothetical protein
MDTLINTRRVHQEEHARRNAVAMTTTFQSPNLDFETQGFPFGTDTRPVNHKQPSPLPARPGFTRTPEEGDILVCANCDAELGEGDTEEKRQVWVIKDCGHV